ncbi:MAG: hypothetical protein WCC06_10545 [Candidatus Aminicenantales bacterium]
MKITVRLLLIFSFLSVGLAADGSLIGRFTVIPDESGQFVTVEAEFPLQNKTPYLKDFGQMEHIRWYVNNQEVSIEAERKKDLLVFRGLPASGLAKAVYKLKCITRPDPGYRKHLMGSSSYILAREGLFLGLTGRENELVEIHWILPPGWSLALGSQGPQRFVDTQRKLWVAGKMNELAEEKIGKNVFRIAVIEGTFEKSSRRSMEAMKAIFLYAWQTFGPLDVQEFGLAVFPRESIGGGTALGYTLATEDYWITAVHEMLHWWTNPHTPAWFREGVHTYISAKILVRLGLISHAEFMQFLKNCLLEHHKVIEREGERCPLAKSSENYDLGRGGGDIYGLMPLFAYKLDREIQAHSPSASLDQVFAAVCRERRLKFDLLPLIKKETGFDPERLFQTYFYVRVEDTDALLR